MMNINLLFLNSHGMVLCTENLGPEEDAKMALIKWLANPGVVLQAGDELVLEQAE